MGGGALKNKVQARGINLENVSQIKGLGFSSAEFMTRASKCGLQGDQKVQTSSDKVNQGGVIYSLVIVVNSTVLLF